MRTIAKSALAFAILLACFAGLGYSQGTDLGTIRGTVTDASGAVVPHAKVEVTDLSTNITRQLTTNNEGNYEATALKSGNYKVTVSAPGFANAEISSVALNAGDAVRADARLSLASASQSVVITAEAPLVHTENQTI